jgi:hypothetical protein
LPRLEALDTIRPPAAAATLEADAARQGMLIMLHHHRRSGLAGVAGWTGALLAMLAVALSLPAAAHHSFAVFFDTDGQLRKVTGVVKEFRFTNPHGVVAIAVREGSQEVIWRAETNSPSILRRRGWSMDSLHPGETITIEGWPARDGTRYMRLRSATRASGEPVGTVPTPPQEKK